MSTFFYKCINPKSVITSSQFLVETLNSGDSFARNGSTGKEGKIVDNIVEAWLSESGGGR